MFASSLSRNETFSVEYWKWQHRFLLDAVAQHDPPSLFLTISPYEWSFPLPPWLTSLRQVTGKGPTELALLETSHIVHVLEQIICLVICVVPMTKNGATMSSTTTESPITKTWKHISTGSNSKTEELYTFTSWFGLKTYGFPCYVVISHGRTTILLFKSAICKSQTKLVSN